MPSKKPSKTQIFVFGSNLAGRHGKGAALEARQKHGAIYGQGVGPQGQSYAVPTKDAELRPLPLSAIEPYVIEFMAYAEAHPELEFKVTALGTGLAGYSHEQMAPLFCDAPENCRLPDEWNALIMERFGC